MKNLQTAPIQVPDFQTCKLLKEAGLLPPEEAFFFIGEGRIFAYCGNDLLNGNYAGKDVYFAPTADQLLSLVIKLAIEKGYNLSLQFGKDYGADWIPHFKNIPVLPNPNAAQYLAEVLLWLLKQ